MKTLITPAQVLRLAFEPAEQLAPQTISEIDIAAAEQRYLLPALGLALYEKLLSGAYADFTAEYLAAPVALFTRLAIQPRLDIRTGQCGTTAPRSSYVQPADQAARRQQRAGLRSQARTLLRRASAQLAAHRAQYPEYDPQNDITNRCSIDGNLVQTH